MKNLILLFLMLNLLVEGQTNITIQAPPANSSSQVRAPSGNAAHAGMKACYLVRQTELSALTGSLVNSIGFELLNGTSSVPVSGNFTVYLQNTGDVNYNKGNSYSAALTGMTAYCTTVMTVPVSPTLTSIILNFTPTFTYTGGGLYVAFEWSSTGPFDLSFATYKANYIPVSALGATSFSAGIPAANTMTLTDFRPAFLFNAVNTATNNVTLIDILVPGKVARLSNAGHIITSTIRNSSTGPLSNIAVSLAVSGANTFANGLIVPLLAPGQVTTVAFSPFNPLVNGLNNITVTVPADDYSGDNAVLATQSVTCDDVAIHPPSPASVYISQGYGAGASSSGIIYSFRYTALASGSLAGVKVVIPGFSAAANLGKQIYSVLQDNTGAIVATGNTITITAGMLDQFSTVGFPTPPAIILGQDYNFGIAIPTNGYFPIGNTAFTSAAVPGYFSSPITGGSYISLSVGHLSLEGKLLFNSLVSVSQTQSLTCGNASFTLNATGAVTYSWAASSGGPFGSNQSSLAVVPIIPSGIISYTAFGIDPSGCAFGSAIAVHSVSALPNVTITGSNNSYCINQAAILTAGGAATYSWNTGATTSTLSISNSALGITNYTVLGTNPVGCQKTSSISILVNPLPTVAIIPSTVKICKGESTVLIATGGSSYSWQNLSNNLNIGTNPTLALAPSATTSYSVSGTDLNGCSASSTISVVVDPCTGISTNLDNTYSLLIIPNPNSGKFRIESAKPGFLSIYNPVGQIVFKMQLPDGINEFDLADLKKGIYFLELESAHSTYKRKLVIQ